MAMDTMQSNRRSDRQLEAILRETGHWVVNGQLGQVLCFAASLGRALDRSSEYAASGAVVVAICRLPSDNIIVFPEQIGRLQKLIAAHELVPIEETMVGWIAGSPGYPSIGEITLGTAPPPANAEIAK
jgi:hypothetical protein